MFINLTLEFLIYLWNFLNTTEAKILRDCLAYLQGPRVHRKEDAFISPADRTGFKRQPSDSRINIPR